jgi:hypothetical protein
VICPECKSEYRPGFHRCSSCNVDLVDEDTFVEPSEAAHEPHTNRMDPHTEADLFPFCGFLSIEDARHAREDLREAGIPSDILIREAASAEETVEEYWIRVPRRRFAEVADVLHEEPAEAERKGGNGELGGGDTFACSECGEDVPADADVCPSCGARFDE